MKLTRKFEIKIVSENKDEINIFMREELHKQFLALNFTLNHYYFKHVATQEFKQINEIYNEKIEEQNEKIEKKLNNLINVKEKANKAKDKEKALKRVQKAQIELNNAKDKLTELEKQFNNQAEKIYQKAIILNEDTLIDNLIHKKFKLHYDTVNRIISKVKADFENNIDEILKGERTIQIYKKTDNLMIRNRSMVIYKEGDDYFLNIRNKWANSEWGKGVLFKIILKKGSKQKAKKK